MIILQNISVQTSRIPTRNGFPVSNTPLHAPAPRGPRSLASRWRDAVDGEESVLGTSGVDQIMCVRSTFGRGERAREVNVEVRILEVWSAEVGEAGREY